MRERRVLYVQRDNQMTLFDNVIYFLRTSVAAVCQETQDQNIDHEDSQHENTISSSISTLPKCPVCEVEIDYVDLTEHVDVCLRTYEVMPEDIQDASILEEEGDVDVDDIEGLETYTWAGQTRVRSTSLVDGGLRGAGFQTITRGDEDQVLCTVSINVPFR